MKEMKEMKVGDLIKCGNEVAIVLDAYWTTNYPQVQWIECCFSDGQVEHFDTSQYGSLEVIK